MFSLPVVLVLFLHHMGVALGYLRLQTHSARIGSSTIIPCKFNVNAMQPTTVTISWHFQGGEIFKYPDYPEILNSRFSIDRDRVTDGIADLYMSGVSIADGGLYKCLMVQNQERTENEIRLDVHAPPSITIQDKTVTRAEKSVLHRVISGFYPVDIDIKWLSDGKILHNVITQKPQRDPDGTYSVRSSVTITPTEEDRGRTFSCRVLHESLTAPLQEDFQLVFSDTEKSTMYIIIGAVVGGVVLIIIISVVAICHFKKRGKKNRNEVTSLENPRETLLHSNPPDHSDPKSRQDSYDKEESNKHKDLMKFQAEKEVIEPLVNNKSSETKVQGPDEVPAKVVAPYPLNNYFKNVTESNKDLEKSQAGKKEANHPLISDKSLETTEHGSEEVGGQLKAAGDPHINIVPGSKNYKDLEEYQAGKDGVNEPLAKYESRTEVHIPEVCGQLKAAGDPHINIVTGSKKGKDLEEYQAGKDGVNEPLTKYESRTEVHIPDEAHSKIKSPQHFTGSNKNKVKETQTEKKVNEPPKKYESSFTKTNQTTKVHDSGHQAHQDQATDTTRGSPGDPKSSLSQQQTRKTSTSTRREPPLSPVRSECSGVDVKGLMERYQNESSV